MKKPLREEIAGLKKEFGLFSFLLLVIFLCSKTFPQVPINGFCKLNTFKVDSDNTSLFSLNFNNDSHTDLILYNPYKKQVSVLTGDRAGNFGRKRRFNIPYEITKIISFKDYQNRVIGYAFTSRKNRRMGIYDFSREGRPYLKQVIKFDSYPENISAAIIDNKKIESLLISGAAFNGLSIISADKSGLKNRKIATNISYTNAVFIDFNNDSYPDIVAYNLIESTLDFFENDTQGNFRKIRSIKVKDKINSLQSFDFNLDGYQDLIYSTGNTINIILGDSVSSYTNMLTIETSYYPDKIILGDFNRDGQIDIAYINKFYSTLSIIYNKTGSEFYPEVIYLKKEGLENIIPYYSRFINGIALVSSKGYLYLESTLLSMAGNVDISLGAEASAVSFFDLDNNGIIDLCFIDKFNNSLDLVARNNSGIPSVLYSTKLFKNESQIIVDNVDPKEKTFYCFTPDKNLIEVISYNFMSSSAGRYSLYTSGKINDLKLYRKDNSSKIYVVSIKDGNLILSTFVKNITGFNTSENTGIAGSVFAANIATVSQPQIFYWQLVNQRQSWYRVSPSGNFKVPIKYSNFSSLDTTLICSFAGDLLNKDEAFSISFFETMKNNFALISGGNSPVSIVNKDFVNHFRIKNKNQLFFGEIKPGGLQKLFIYVPGESALYKFDFIRNGKEIVVTKVIEAPDVESFFVSNMNFRDYFFVYSDSVDHCIKIRQLNR
jgi:FG-GAP-like repeat